MLCDELEGWGGGGRGAQEGGDVCIQIDASPLYSAETKATL